MKKLFIIPDEGNHYYEEIICAHERLNGHSPLIGLEDLSVDYVERNGNDVVISAGLPRQWNFALRGMDVVTITFGERERFYDPSDIVID